MHVVLTQMNILDIHFIEVEHPILFITELICFG